MEQTDPTHEPQAVIEARILAAIDRAKTEILADISAGVHRPNVPEFSELHDGCDANCYGGGCDNDTLLSVANVATVQAALDDWLGERAKRLVAVTAVVYFDPPPEVDAEALLEAVEARLCAVYAEGAEIESQFVSVFDEDLTGSDEPR